MPHISLRYFTHPPPHFPFPSSKFQTLLSFPFSLFQFSLAPPFPSFPPYFHFLPHYFHPQNFKSLLQSQNLSLIHYSLSLFHFHYHFLSHTLTFTLLPPFTTSTAGTTSPPPLPPSGTTSLQHHHRPCPTLSLSLSLYLSSLFISLYFFSL